MSRRDDRLAVEAYTAAVALNPGPDSRHRKLAEALERVGRHDDACATFEEAVRLRPGDERAEGGRSRCAARAAEESAHR